MGVAHVVRGEVDGLTPRRAVFDELQAKAAQEEVGHLEVSTGQGGDLLDGGALGLELVFHGEAEEVAVEGDGALQVADGEGGVVVRGNHEPLPLKELRLRVVG